MNAAALQLLTQPLAGRFQRASFRGKEGPKPLQHDENFQLDARLLSGLLPGNNNNNNTIDPNSNINLNNNNNNNNNHNNNNNNLNLPNSNLNSNINFNNNQFTNNNNLPQNVTNQFNDFPSEGFGVDNFQNRFDNSNTMNLGDNLNDINNIINPPNVVTPQATLAQLSEAVTDPTVHEIVLSLYKIQQLKEKELASRRTELRSQHHRERQQMIATQKMRLARYHPNATSALLAQNAQELQSLERNFHDQLLAFDHKAQEELDSKILEQQTVLQQAGVPGFFPTKNKQEVELQAQILRLVLQAAKPQDGPPPIRMENNFLPMDGGNPIHMGRGNSTQMRMNMGLNMDNGGGMGMGMGMDGGYQQMMGSGVMGMGNPNQMGVNMNMGGGGGGIGGTGFSGYQQLQQQLQQQPQFSPFNNSGMYSPPNQFGFQRM